MSRNTVKGRVRIGGGQYITKLVNIPNTIRQKEESLPTPQTQVVTPAAATPVIKSKVKQVIAVPEAVVTLPIKDIGILNPPRTESKTVRNKILKAINDSLSGKELKPVKQLG